MHVAGQLFEEVRKEQDDAEEPKITGTAVSEAVVPIVFTPMQDRRCACVVP